jgi:hypothetical protein
MTERIYYSSLHAVALDHCPFDSVLSIRSTETVEEQNCGCVNVVFCVESLLLLI